MGIIAFWIWDFGFRIEVAEGPVKNNGSLRSQKITFAGLSEAYEQTYTYDDLNRLKSAEEKIGSTTNWKQTFNYDRYGNRTFDAANTTTISVSNTVTNPSASTSTNRLAGHTYDAAGNLTVDAENRRFVYDAENHQTKLFLAANNSETPDAVYKYDGDGRRVKKISSTETTVFVYDGGGTLVAEYTALTGNDPAPTPQVSYLTQDHLGSPRVVTNQNGEVIKRTDWMAFGEEVEFNKRGTGVGYDEVPETRKGYTGYEKDDESGLDFAQARYYNPKHGRYTSVDPLTASANVRNPQTFNRYTYVLNSPYKFSDPLGLIAENTGYRDSTGTCGAEYSGCDDSKFSGGILNPTEEPAPESNTDSAGEPLASDEGGGDDQQAAPPAAPPPAGDQNEETSAGGASVPRDGRIVIESVKVFDTLPEIVPVPGTSNSLYKPKPIADLGVTDQSVSTDLPGEDVFYVLVTASVEGDALFSVGQDVPTVVANGPGNLVERTMFEDQKEKPRPAYATEEEWREIQLKPRPEFSDQESPGYYRRVSVLFAVRRNKSLSRSGSVTVGFSATSTQGLIETSIMRPRSNPTNHVTITFNGGIPQ